MKSLTEEEEKELEESLHRAATVIALLCAILVLFCWAMLL